MKKPRIALLALLFALSAGVASAAAPDSEPLVSFNGQTITAGELKHFIAMHAESPAPPPGSAMTQAEFENTVARQALESLVERRLLLEAARTDYGDSEAARAGLQAYGEQELRKLEDRAGSRLRAGQVLAEQGLTPDEYKQYQVDSLLIMRLMWSKVYSHVAVKPAELRKYYADHPGEFRQPRAIFYRQILFTVPDPQQAPARRAEAERVLQQIQQGADFAQMAESHSADADKYPGGLHRVEVPDAQPDWRPAVLEGLKVGQTSAVQDIGGSFSIARFEGIREPRVLSFAEVQDELSRQLLEQKRADAQAAFVDELKGKARIEYLAGAQELGLRAAGPAR